MPAIRPPPPTGTNTASMSPPRLAQDLHADGALPGDHVRIVEGMHEHQVALARQLQRMLKAAS